MAKIFPQLLEKQREPMRNGTASGLDCEYNWAGSNLSLPASQLDGPNASRRSIGRGRGRRSSDRVAHTHQRSSVDAARAAAEPSVRPGRRLRFVSPLRRCSLLFVIFFFPSVGGFLDCPLRAVILPPQQRVQAGMTANAY